MQEVICDEAELAQLGARLAAMLRPGDAILLGGPLGAGKTTLARAIIRAACADPALDVPSPSYTLVQTYERPGAASLHHYDLWRLRDAAGLPELGWEEARDDIVLVEWPDRLGMHAPRGALRVEIRPEAAASRRIALDGWADRLEYPKIKP